MEMPEILTFGIYNAQLSERREFVTRKREVFVFEIDCPIENGGVSYIDGEEAPIRPGLLICAKPGQVRNTKLPYRCYHVHFRLSKGLLYDVLMNTSSLIHTDNYDEYIRLFSKLTSFNDAESEEDKIIVYSLLLEIIYRLAEDSKKSDKSKIVGKNNDKQIEKIQQYISEHLNEDLCLKRVSEIAGFSPIHFHNLFKSVTGKTLCAYVEEKRIRKAVNMLLTTEKPISQITYECGFSSQSYFSYAFKRKTGYTPRQYIKRVYSRYEKSTENE